MNGICCVRLLFVGVPFEITPGFLALLLVVGLPILQILD